VLALEPCIDWPRALSLETLLEAELPDAIASAGLGRSTSDAISLSRFSTECEGGR